MSDRKTLETKRKIVTLTRNREIPAATKLFYKYFTNEKPADLEFISTFFLELNRLNLFEVGYQLLADTSKWFENDPDHQTLFESAGKLYVDSLVLQGNNFIFERDETINRFDASLKRSDSLSREKMRVENEKILNGITGKALRCFEKARAIQPDNLVALAGLQNCYEFLHEAEKLAEVEQAIAAKKPDLSHLELPTEATGFDGFGKRTDGEVDVEDGTLNHVKELLEQKKYDEVVKEVDRLHLSHRVNVLLLLMKAKALAQLRRFKEVDKVIFEAERENSHPFELKDTKNDLNELRYQLLVKAGDIYLSKAVAMGSSLGLPHFKKARIALQRALALNPENLDLLDKFYTTLKYLGEEEEAFKTKAMIYVLDPKFITTFDSTGTSNLCFLASFAFAGEPRVLDDFRWFRREFLLSNAAGRQLNSIYVRFSPAIVNFCKPLPYAKEILRSILHAPLLVIKLLKYIV